MLNEVNNGPSWTMYRWDQPPAIQSDTVGVYTVTVTITVTVSQAAPLEASFTHKIYVLPSECSMFNLPYPQPPPTGSLEIELGQTLRQF